jgi:hypothetical protein
MLFAKLLQLFNQFWQGKCYILNFGASNHGTGWLNAYILECEFGEFGNFGTVVRII